MKRIGFTCTDCGAPNIPRAGECWKGSQPCRYCGSINNGSMLPPERTAPRLYRKYSDEWGLPVKTIFELQKRGILPRDLGQCTALHVEMGCAVALALSSEEILRAALATIPKARRKKLVCAVPTDGLLTAWQRYVLNRYLDEYRTELHHNHPTVIDGKSKRFGGQVTSIPQMIRILEELFRLPATTTRSSIKAYKKVAYNRIFREIKKSSNGRSRHKQEPVNDE